MGSICSERTTGLQGVYAPEHPQQNLEFSFINLVKLHAESVSNKIAVMFLSTVITTVKEFLTLMEETE